MSRALPWLLVVVIAAAIAHVAAVWAVPRAIMHVTWTRMAETGGTNVARHAARATHDSRSVVRPSPDLLYSICVYDLGAGPLRVSAPVPPDTYWSVSAFAMNTDNFLVVNDRQAGTSVDFILAGPNAAVEKPEGLSVFVAPGPRGLVLFRTLVADETRLAAIDEVRRKARCAPYAPAPAATPAPAQKTAVALLGR